MKIRKKTPRSALQEIGHKIKIGISELVRRKAIYPTIECNEKFQLNGKLNMKIDFECVKLITNDYIFE